MMKTIFSLAALAVSLGAAPARAARYGIDTSHSSVEFKVRHMVVSKTHGKFNKFSGDFEFEPGKPKAWRARAVIDAASIDTANEKRDGHLRSADFLDVAKHPSIEFVSRKVTDLKDGKAKLHGDLTIRGVTKPVVLDLEVHGVVTDPSGKERSGFSARGKINRTDYGVSWNRTLDTGGLVVGEEVEISLEVEGIRQDEVETKKGR